jgi:hypothetical protein
VRARVTHARDRIALGRRATRAQHVVARTRETRELTRSWRPTESVVAMSLTGDNRRGGFRLPR